MTIGKQVKMWTIQEIAEFYKKFSIDYDQEIQRHHNDDNNNNNNKKEEKQNTYPAPFIIGNWLNHHLTFPATTIDDLRILDLGCGTGQSGIVLLDNAKKDKRLIEIIGIDGTPEMSLKALERGYKMVITHDLEVFPYPTTIETTTTTTTHCTLFDGIVCVGVMEFIKQPLQFLILIKQYLRRDKKSAVGLTLPETHPHTELSSFTLDEMYLLFRDAGYKIMKHERFIGYVDSQSGLEQFYNGFLICPSD